MPAPSPTSSAAPTEVAPWIHRPPSARRDLGAAVALCVAGLACSSLFAYMAPEGILQFDDLTHYLYARWAWRWPAYLLDEWGRPGFTALYFLPAKLGWGACRLLSACLTACTAYLAFEIARRMGLPHAWSAVLLFYAAPLCFQASQTTLTETPLMFYLSLAVFLAQHGRWSLSAAVLSPALVTRHEAAVFIPLWMIATLLSKAGQPNTAAPSSLVQMLWSRRCRLTALWPIVWAPLVVNLAALGVGLPPAVSVFFELKEDSQYGKGGWLTFFSRSLEAFGPGLAVLAMAGMPAAWRLRGGPLLVCCAVVYFAAHTVIRALGLFGSGGYARFLVPITPMIAVCALAGWHQLWSRDGVDRRIALTLVAAAMLLLWAAMERQYVLYQRGMGEMAELPHLHEAMGAMREATSVLVPLALLCAAVGRHERWNWPIVPGCLVYLMVVASFHLCHPLWPPPEAAAVAEFQRFVAENKLEQREVVSAQVWLDWKCGRELPPDRPSVREQIAQAPVGSLFAWERQFAESPDHGLRLEEFEQSSAFRLVFRSGPRPFAGEPYLTVFEKIAPWPHPETDPPRPPRRPHR